MMHPLSPLSLFLSHSCKLKTPDIKVVAVARGTSLARRSDVYNTHTEKSWGEKNERCILPFLSRRARKTGAKKTRFIKTVQSSHKYFIRIFVRGGRRTKLLFESRSEGVGVPPWKDHLTRAYSLVGGKREREFGIYIWSKVYRYDGVRLGTRGDW